MYFTVVVFDRNLFHLYAILLEPLCNTFHLFFSVFSEPPRTKDNTILEGELKCSCFYCASIAVKLLMNTYSPRDVYPRATFLVQYVLRRKGKLEKFTPPQKQTQKVQLPVNLEINLRKNKGVSVGRLSAGSKSWWNGLQSASTLPFTLSVLGSVSWYLQQNLKFSQNI